MIEPNENEAGQDYRLPPSNAEVEQALLGALLVNNSALNKVSGFLQPEHFYEPAHQRIYDAIKKTVEAGGQADPVKLKPYFEADEGLKDVGGAGYLIKLAASAATIINAGDYGRTIYDLAQRRDLIVIGENMVLTAYDSPIDQPAETQIEDAETALRELATGDANQSSAMLIGNIMDEAIDEIDESHKLGIQPGLTTGLKDLDNRIGGLHPTDLIIIAGRPAMLKSTLATNIAKGAAQSLENYSGKHDGVVVLYSLEMPKKQLGERMMADLSFDDKIVYSKARTMKFTADERSIMRQNVTAYHSMPLVVEDRAPMTLASLTSSCRRMASLWASRGQPLKLIIIDYLQLIAFQKGQFDKVGHLVDCTRGLKLLAKELHIPVIVLSQLNRQCEMRENKRPMLSDLRGSGSIEEDADMVLFMFREYEYLKKEEPRAGLKHDEWKVEMAALEHVVEIGVGKQRHGPTGFITLAAFPSYGSIRDRAQQELL